jgi:hypothetical protein
MNVKNNYLIICLIMLLISCGDTSKLESQTVPNNDTNIFTFLSSLKLPDKLSFCGEQVPLEIPEVRERAEREFYMLLQQPGQVILYLKRAGRYFPVYEKIIKENNMPTDLKYLSVAESALYMARSAKNALGLWQFMEGTGKKYGLQVDDNVDERCHPEKSTDAAMKYLKNAYDDHGSWSLAAAAYNMGSEGVSSSKKFQDVNNYFDMYLNEETSRFVLRIVIIKEIMENASKYGFIVPPADIYKPDEYKVIEVDGAVPNLSDWAKSQGTTYKDVKLLNPWILGRSLPQPKKGNKYEIAVPEKH